MEKPLTSVRRESMDLAGLLEEHGDHLLRLCTLYLGDRSQAEDAVQDTFLRALRAWPGFRGDCAVETWLVRIAINVCKRQLRSPWRLLRAPQESLDSLRMEGPEPPDDTLVRAIQALPPKYGERKPPPSAAHRPYGGGYLRRSGRDRRRGLTLSTGNADPIPRQL